MFQICETNSDGIALIIPTLNMLREISRHIFWERVAARITFDDTTSALKRQFSLRFWPIKLVIHVVAWCVTILLLFSLFPQAQDNADTVVGILDRPCDIRLRKMCSNPVIWNCSGNKLNVANAN